MNFGPWELIIILVILLLLFGSTRLPQLAKGMGKSIKEFKRGVSEGDEEDRQLESARQRELRPGESTRLHEDELSADKFSLNKPR
ncbi:MAG: twin-arginine translocase TatA/TatE family subunit [Pyrinomonadaceae bacterium]|nr:twin-arginine translocase TatA/TatE family subunit [Pyrinomonadaceae bacterium]MDQ3686845.1 twin-arginine translocase TatA/TatE family subunit [Acidobacteriota bacterium]